MCRKSLPQCAGSLLHGQRIRNFDSIFGGHFTVLSISICNAKHCKFKCLLDAVNYFSLYVLFSQYRPCDNTSEDYFFQIFSYSSASAPPGGGGGVLPYITYTGMCRPTGVVILKLLI